MNEPVPAPEGRAAGMPLDLAVLEALAELLPLREPSAGPVRDATELRATCRNLREALELLLGFYLEMDRGVAEFRRAYALATGEEPQAFADRTALARRLVSGPDAAGARALIARRIQEIKLHQAALLEGYQCATHEGSHAILREIDPDTIRGEFCGARVRFGPVTVPLRSRALREQAVWEEMQRRVRALLQEDPATLERLYRSAFLKGYSAFQHGRGGEGDRTSPAPTPEDAPSKEGP